MKNELKHQFLSINSLNPWTPHDSSSRGNMFSSSHIGQSLVIEGCTPRRCQTGLEREFGKFTFSIKTPSNISVIKVIPKYRKTIGMDSITQNPSSLVIYECVETKEIGMLELIRHSTAVDNKHQHFGFKYKYKDIANNLFPGAILKKDTILADSPAIDDNGNYCYGIESQVAFMSVPGIIEDGVVVSESYLKKIRSKGFEKRVASWGKKLFPLNLYGDANNYKPFPDIGDRIRKDGLLFALREYDDLLGPIEMSPAATMQPDYIFDKLIYAEPNAKVVDITVFHDDVIKVNSTPVGMDRQTIKYHNGMKNYYLSIIEVYQDLYNKRKDSLNLSRELHRLLVEAMVYVGMEDNPIVRNMRSKEQLNKRKIQKLYRRNDIDDWRVEVTFEYDVEPTIGFKITDAHGGKGVICDVWPDELMPVDQAGNRAEIIMDGDSTIKRMNFGRLYEHYLNAASRDVTNFVKEVMSNSYESGGYKTAWDYLMGYYKIVSPKMHGLMSTYSEDNIKNHVDSVVKDGVYLWIPTDNPIDPIQMVQEVEKSYAPLHKPVTYMDGVVTEKRVLIGTLYILLLEKTGTDWSGTSSAKLQHFGIPAKVSNADKHSTPGRNNPVRITGEAEVRLFNAAVGSDVVVDILDQSNSPTTHKAIVNKILTSDTPTYAEEIIDRNEIPLGNSRSLLFVKHILECAGIEFVRELDDPVRIQEVEDKLKQRKG